MDTHSWSFSYPFLVFLVLVLLNLTMPPFIGVKRRRSPSLSVSLPATPEVSAKKTGKKQSLFDAADERPVGSLKGNEDFVNGLAESDSDTSLSDVSSIEFEDVTPQPAAKKRKVNHHDVDEEEIDWEDAMHEDQTIGTPSTAVQPSGDLELTLDKGSGVRSFVNNQKKGPSKIERQIRVVTHCMHVQFLLFHNSMRSRFACDPEVQKILVDQLSPTAKKEIETWRLASGQVQDEINEKSPDPLKLKRGKKGEGKKSEDVRSQRDWGTPAERQEKGVANTSRGDPVYRLLKFLAAYWKKRFTITAPCLRKQGYKSLARLEEEIASFKNDEHNVEEHGERIACLEGFRDHAKMCEGSRGVGAQLFVALLRGLGLEARLVASLQPVGFGWNKNEEASPKKKRSRKDKPERRPPQGEIGSDMEIDPPSSKPSIKAGTQARKIPKGRQQDSKKKKENVGNGSKSIPIDLSDSSSSDLSSIDSDDDSASIVEITPSTPQRKFNVHYDRDFVTPTYWAEVISPITHQIFPVDPFILTPSVATKPEHLNLFESRGARADKAKQVFAYIIAYSPDGTAKDVTTRYLKKRMWPGRTKGVRLPVERIPIHDSKGKIKHHEEYDWFKTVISGYTRPDHMRTAVDDIEDATDLKPVKPEKKEATKEKEGTLQFYKTSAEYVLERHLRREEAIIPDAEPVKHFTAGKGEDKKEEPVFLRKDVLVCRTGESWHKEGRQIKPNQTPMKMVPIRAVTLTRKREVEEAERDGGEKLKQGLYARDQTEWIIPPPIVNGVIPKNAYGNMDCFVPTMVPEGAAHIPLRSTGKICKRLGIDYAEAVTGFEFGKQRAVPVVTGVVVAKEHEEVVLREWEKDEEERRIKEEGKREKVALAMWKKLIVGLRIVERVRGEYGEGGEMKEESNPFTNKKRKEKPERTNGVVKVPEIDGGMDQDDDGNGDMAGGFVVDSIGDDDANGGFLPDGSQDQETTYDHEGGGFLPDDPEKSDAGGGFLREGYDDNVPLSPSNNGEDLNQLAGNPNGVHPPPPPKEDSPDTDDDQPPLGKLKQPKVRKGKPAKAQKIKNTPHKPPADHGPENQPGIPALTHSPRQPTRSRKRKSGRPASTAPPPRQTPQRRSARQSGIVVRSRYFEGGREE